GPAGDSGLRQRDAALPLVLAAAIPVRGFAYFVRLEKQHLRDALVGINLRRQRRRVGKLQRYVPLPLRFQRRDVDDDAAPGIGRFAQADRQDAARNAEKLDGARERERVGRNDADGTFEIDERFLVEALRIDNRRIDVREDLELVGAAHVVAVARGAVGNDLLTAGHADLFGRKRIDHAGRGRHAPNPPVALDAHQVASTVIFGNKRL